MKDFQPKQKETCPRCNGEAFWVSTSETDEPIYLCNRCQKRFKVSRGKQGDLVRDFGFPDVPKDLKFRGKTK